MNEDSDGYLPIAARFLMYSSKDSPYIYIHRERERERERERGRERERDTEAMAPFLPRELFSADTGVGSLVCALGVPPQAAS